MLACGDPLDPVAQPVVGCAFVGHPQHRAGAMDQHHAEMAIPMLADTEQPRLAASAVLARHQAEPGGQIPATAKLAGIADTGKQRRAVDRPNAGR